MSADALAVVFAAGMALADPCVEIVLPDAATHIETFAAEELRHHLRKSLGREIEIVSESAAGRRRDVRHLYVGRTETAAKAGLRAEALKDEEHVVAGVHGDIILVGGDRDLTDGKLQFGDTSGRLCCGTLYAVYEFLERHMGVSWIWPGELGEVVPRRGLPVLDGKVERGREPLVQRQFGGESDTEKIPAGGSMEGWANVENARKDVAARRLWLIRHRIGARRKFNGSHAFTDWWERYGKTHPEYFNLLPNGRREPLQGDPKGQNVTLCVSNPDLWRQIVENWAKGGSSRSHRAYYTACVNCCENDTPGMCTCAGCRGWDAPDPRFGAHPYWSGDPVCPLKKDGRFLLLADVQWGETGGTEVLSSMPAVSDRYVRFYNAVLAEARKRVKEAEVYGYAYANYLAAPRQTFVADGVIISFVPRMYFPYTASESANFRSEWTGWRRAGAKQMIYRPNYMLAGANLPYNTARRIADDIAFAATNGMMAISQDSLTGVWSAQAIQNYVLTRLMRAPTKGYERSLAEFLSAFGKASGEIRDYCALLEQVGAGLSVEDWQKIGQENKDRHGNAGGGFKNHVLVAADVYDAKWFLRAAELLDAATVKARSAGDADVVLARIDFLRKGLRDAELTYLTRVAQKSGDQEAFRRALEKLDGYRAEVEADGICSYYWTASREASGAGWYRKSRREATAPLLDGWEFSSDAVSWRSVRLPHDWAIEGPFSRTNDLQHTMIVQDGEKTVREHTGRTGGLPWTGEGWYRRTVELAKDIRVAELVFDGAMSHAEVFSDGERIGGSANGYAPFAVKLPLKRRQVVSVRLSNLPQSSRWYPGAGLIRPVFLRQDPAVRAEEVFVWTEKLEGNRAHMRVTSPLGDRSFVIDNPLVWTPEHPHLYTLSPEGVRYGVRSISWTNGVFCLNGKSRKFKGVCLHHDLGPIGAAFNCAAFRRQVRLLKGMGCDAIRTAHNIPSGWQLDICDEEGMMVMAESFDEWRQVKCANGYHLDFEANWRRDLETLLRFCRNHPSVVMWSIGNEIPEQSDRRSVGLCREMVGLCHRLDPTRPVTQGFDRLRAAIDNGYVAAMDVPGLNYRLPFCAETWNRSANRLVVGSETASTVSSRGVYKFPAEVTADETWDDGQCSSYDLGCCSWSNLPDDDWAVQDASPWLAGEFVWTGFDYLGEPTPYKEYWPSRSAYFGIFDLAGLPKDRYWLYRSRWNVALPTLHLLPHWTWPDRVGQVTPVFCYTSYPAAELFVNGRSQGKRTKDTRMRLDRYRLRWNEVVYEPGELKVVAYDAGGRAVAEETVRTSGRPARLVLSADRMVLSAADRARTQDLAFVTVKVVDMEGNLCPDVDVEVSLTATGAVRYLAACNGDATSLVPFAQAQMKAFHGQLVAIVATEKTGPGSLEAVASGLAKAQCPFFVSK